MDTVSGVVYRQDTRSNEELKKIDRGSLALIIYKWASNQGWPEIRRLIISMLGRCINVVRDRRESKDPI